MSWNFRTKLMVAFLIFGLVPTLILTLVTLDATRQLQDRAARVVHRGAFFNAGAFGKSPLAAEGNEFYPIINRESVDKANAWLDRALQEIGYTAGQMAVV